MPFEIKHARAHNYSHTWLGVRHNALTINNARSSLLAVAAVVGRGYFAVRIIGANLQSKNNFREKKEEMTLSLLGGGRGENRFCHWAMEILIVASCAC